MLQLENWSNVTDHISIHRNCISCLIVIDIPTSMRLVMWIGQGSFWLATPLPMTFAQFFPLRHLYSSLKVREVSLWERSLNQWLPEKILTRKRLRDHLLPLIDVLTCPSRWSFNLELHQGSWCCQQDCVWTPEHDILTCRGWRKDCWN